MELYIYLLLPQAFLSSASDILLSESFINNKELTTVYGVKSALDTNTWNLSGKGGRRRR